MDDPLFSLAQQRPADEHLDYRALVAERTLPFPPGSPHRSPEASGRPAADEAATGTDGPTGRITAPR